MILVICLGLLLRALTGLFGYSGQGKPPLYGDYEAQRHWMEITYNLPISEWYHNTSNNDLLYWGLDYPPLTAYHSWVCGWIGNIIDPSYVALEESRGIESNEHKTFMRYAVLIVDILFYFVPVILIASETRCKLTNLLDFDLRALALLSYPGMVLIDHGHFQFNCVSLGLTLASYWALKRNHDSLSAVAFTLALNYKQMTLYYSLPFFAYFLNKCFSERATKGFTGILTKFVKLGASVVLTFVILWAPFAATTGISQVVHRLFPVARGVFEDKVSNFWCVFNIFFKIRAHYSNSELAAICALLTLVSCLPSFCHMIFTKNHKTLTLLYSLFNCSLAFFLFSFQVHEKTILLVALPALLLVEQEYFHCFWFLLVSIFSMLPLLVKDNLFVPLISLTFFFFLSTTIVAENNKIQPSSKRSFPKWFSYMFQLSLIGMAVLTALILNVPPPPKYPDLFPLLISAYSAGHFVYFYLYFTWAQLSHGVKR